MNGFGEAMTGRRSKFARATCGARCMPQIGPTVRDLLTRNDRCALSFANRSHRSDAVGYGLGTGLVTKPLFPPQERRCTVWALEVLRTPLTVGSG